MHKQSSSSAVLIHTNTQPIVWHCSHTWHWGINEEFKAWEVLGSTCDPFPCFFFLLLIPRSYPFAVECVQ